jgi:hypothetical protein
MKTMISNELRLGLDFGDLLARATQVSQGELALSVGGCQNAGGQPCNISFNFYLLDGRL